MARKVAGTLRVPSAHFGRRCGETPCVATSSRTSGGRQTEYACYLAARERMFSFRLSFSRHPFFCLRGYPEGLLDCLGHGSPTRKRGLACALGFDADFRHKTFPLSATQQLHQPIRMRALKWENIFGRRLTILSQVVCMKRLKKQEILRIVCAQIEFQTLPAGGQNIHKEELKSYRRKI